MTNAEAVNWLINITADIGKIEHQDLWHYEQALTEIREMLETEPQRMRGKWIDGQRMRFDGTFHWYRMCSVCDYERDDDNIDMDTNFCPNCGCQMNGDEEDEQ